MGQRGKKKSFRKEGETHKVSCVCHSVEFCGVNGWIKPAGHGKTKMVFFGVMMNESECAGPRLFNKAEGRHVEVTAKIL